LDDVAPPNGGAVNSSFRQTARRDVWRRQGASNQRFAAAWKEQTGGLRLEGNSPDTKYPIAPGFFLFPNHIFCPVLPGFLACWNLPTSPRLTRVSFFIMIKPGIHPITAAIRGYRPKIAYFPWYWITVIIFWIYELQTKQAPFPGLHIIL